MLKVSALRPESRPSFAEERMTRQEAAGYLGLSFSTLENDVVTGRLGVPFYRVGRKPLYRRSDLDAWLEARRVAPAA